MSIPGGHRLIWAGVVAVLVAACNGPAAEDDGRLRVVATFSVLGEMAEAVGGERVATTTVVPVGADPHTYEPKPSDVVAIERADVVVDNALGLSPWLEPLRPRVAGTVLSVGEQVGSSPREDPTGRVDPHVWLDPRLLAEAGRALADTLADADPEGAGEYAERADRLSDELHELHGELTETLAAIPEERRLLATYEYAYSYFADAYDLEIVGSVIGATTEEEPSAAQVRRLIDAVREHDVPAVFPQVGEPTGVLERVARDAGARLGRPLYVDSVGAPGSDADSYAGMMRANAEAVVEGLAGEETDR